MRARWLLAASILALASIPGALHAADAPGCIAPAAPAAVLVIGAANTTASAPALAAAAPPIWAGLPAQISPVQIPQGDNSTPLFLANSCVGCTFALCQRLHSGAGCC
jgi:hypothetical protein